MSDNDKGFSNANVGIQVLPSVPSEKVYPVVDKVIELIANSGVRYEVGPMETTMEGDLEELLDIVRKAQLLCIEAGAGSVMSIVKIHYKPKGVTIDEKVGKYRG